MARSRRRTPSRNRTATRGSGSNTWPYVAGAAFALCILGGLVFLQGRTEREMAVDQITLCPRDTGPVAYTAILLDLTDPLSAVQAQKLRQYLQQEFDQSAIGTQFTMGVVSDDPTSWGATAPLCKPRSGADVSSLTQNVQMVQRRYEEGFISPIDDNLQRMMSASEAKTSPIMEALQALVADTPDFLTTDKPKKIVLVSDLLQHSDAMSFYRGDDWKTFSKSPAYQQLSPVLTGVEIEIYSIPRTTSKVKNPETIEDFWIRYFENEGAELPRLHKLGDF